MLFVFFFFFFPLGSYFGENNIVPYVGYIVGTEWLHKDRKPEITYITRAIQQSSQGNCCNKHTK